MSALSQPRFHCEGAAYRWLEASRWPRGPVCAHCGSMGRIRKIGANPEQRIRIGLCKCGDCKKQFTVKIGTVFEHARLPLHKMRQAVHLMGSSRTGISSRHWQRVLGIRYRTAWFLSRRIREALRDGAPAPSGDGPVDADAAGSKARHHRGEG